jgi:hypothetical protein
MKIHKDGVGIFLKVVLRVEGPPIFYFRRIVFDDRRFKRGVFVGDLEVCTRIGERSLGLSL